MTESTSSSEELRTLRAELERLRSRVAHLEGTEGGPDTRQQREMSRGALLRTAAAAIAGAAGAAVVGAGAGASPALADNGSPVVAGQDNPATGVTSISGSVLTDAGLRVSNYYTGPFDDYSDGLQGYTYGAGLSAIYGRNDAAGGTGVMGYSGSGIGGTFSGGLAPIRLQPGATAGAPATFNHQQGELYVDSAGALWLCTQSGTATTVGTFQQIAVGGGGAVDTVNVYRSGDLSLPTGTPTVIPWDGEHWNTNNLHSSTTNPSHLTAQRDGKYRITGTLMFAPNNGGARIAIVRKNGSTTVGQTQLSTGGGNGGVYFIPYVAEVALGAGDYIEILAYQDSGGSLPIQGGADGACWCGMQLFSI